MKTNLLFLLSVTVIVAAVTCITCELRAQSPPADVPEIAQHEIARRGGHVEMTGTIRHGLMAAALAPPADDSAKWFLTLVVKSGTDTAAGVASAKMTSIIASDPAIRPWVDVREPLKSALHYHVRSVDDATQADWLKGLQPAIAKMGLPLVVLQPPRNGQFGPSSTSIKIVGGVVTGEDLARRLREGIIRYVKTIEPDEEAEVRTGARAGIGSAPPFALPPKDPPAVPDWPPVAPVTPAAPPPNPTVPAAGFPNPWLAMAALGTFALGWLGARLKTSLSAKLAAVALVIETLNKSQASGPKDPPSP